MNSHPTKVSILVFGLLFSTSSLLGQSFTDRFTDSTLSIQFGVSSNFTLYTFEGSGISLTQHVSPLSAIRFGIEARAYGKSTNRKIQQFRNDTLLFSADGNSSSSFLSGDATVQWVRYLGNSTSIGAFFAVGPSFGFTRYPQSSSFSQTSSHSIYRLGLNCSFGGEWFVATDISLHAEYRFVASYSWDINTEKYSPSTFERSIRESTDRHWDFNTSNVRLGLSAYLR